MNYQAFLARKAQLSGQFGFEPLWLPEFLFDFQKSLIVWATLKGRAAIFADCGLGKTPMQLVWAENVARQTNGNVLIITPLAVSPQTAREAEKFHIDCRRSNDGNIASKITVTNYERLHHFDASQFVGVVLDESSILKNFDGARRAEISEFMRLMPYRLLCTATAAPNDYIELGTSSEALGELGYTDMLGRFFKNDQGSIKSVRQWDGAKWRFKKHAEAPFWRWVASWARAVRRPSDLGFPDDQFVLPRLSEQEHVIQAKSGRPDMLFDLPAQGLFEQREERRRSITERCEKVASLVAGNGAEQSLVWCHLNDEGDLLADMIPGAVQVSGSDEDDVKEDRLTAFAAGKVRVLVTKPKIGCLGLNLQRCAHMTFFPSNSYEQYYQGVRRCWRFGQARPVVVDVVASEGERDVLKNLQRKASQADVMFTSLVSYMNEATKIDRGDSSYTTREEVPAWL